MRDPQVVSFPMFDLPELSGQTDRLWSAWRDATSEVGDGPLNRVEPSLALLDHWSSDAILLTQTCGYPFVAALSHRFLIGTFAYDCLNDDDPDGWYRALLVTRASHHHQSLRNYDGLPLVVNNLDSLSGCVSLGVALLDAGVTSIGPVTETGAHATSLALVQSGKADLACVDAITWSLLSRVRPSAVAELRIVAKGPLIPCPPFISGDFASAQKFRSSAPAALNALRAESPETLRSLGIRGFVPMTQDAYDATLGLADRAAQLLPVALRPNNLDRATSGKSELRTQNCSRSGERGGPSL